MDSPPPSELRHVEALDGFRAVAILTVVLFHWTWLACGWIGVQIFFVLSGFLITSILLHDRRLPFRAYMGRFYWRRSLRIFPLYFGYLLVLAAVFAIARAPKEFGSWWPQLFTYTLNFGRLEPGFPNNPFFGHFWSLSVEEQFYVLWPALVFFLPPRAFKWTIVALLLLGPLFRVALVQALRAKGQDAEFLGQAAYSATFCQLDAFAAGAAAAVFRELLARHATRNFVVSVVLLLVAGQWSSWASSGSLALDSGLGYPINMFQNGQYAWGYSLIDLSAMALLVLACRPNAVSRLLSRPALAYVGRISYGMYVFHLPARAAVRALLGTRHGLENLGAFALYVGLTVGAAAVSYRWFESIFLRMKSRFFAAPSGARDRELETVPSGGMHDSR
jgi:peptidoglycan/LPS O-acetylase OafA/YrhL